MKPEELMIGDLVRFDGETVCVLSISTVEINTYEVDCIVPSALEPIPLTPEILDKNFKEKEKDTIGYYQRNKLVPYMVDVRGVDIPNEFITKWNLIWDEVGKYLTIEDDPLIKIRYVHELQHALRLCGLTELADNFKVK